MDGIISWISNNTTTVITSITTTALSVGIQLYWRRKKENDIKLLRPTRLVVIAGCDSGLGLSMALWAQDLGYVVLAGCLNPDGVGAELLNEKGVSVIPLDLTNDDSVKEFGTECVRLMEATGTS